MGTILFLILRGVTLLTPLKVLDTSFDWVIICFLVAIDGNNLTDKCCWLKRKE